MIAGSIAVAGCGADRSGAQRRDPPLVVAVAPTARVFIDRIDAVGTARANEQVTLSTPVTERVVRIDFVDGGFVRAGHVVATLAQNGEGAALTGAQAAERQANQQLDRVRALSSRGFATKSLLDEQTLAASRARASVEEARAQISDRVIRAPFSGYASLRTISAGAVVSAGTPIATISDISRIKLDFSVPETLLRALKPGQIITAVAAAYPDRPFQGRIATIDPVIDPATRAASIRAILPNPGNLIKPGMLLSVRIETASRQAMAVPELAVIGEGADRFVYLVGPGAKAKRAKVTTGSRDAGWIEIEGLQPGSRVITEGVVKVAEGTRVKVRGEKPARTASTAGPAG